MPLRRHAATAGCLLTLCFTALTSCSKEPTDDTESPAVTFPENSWYQVADADFPTDLESPGWQLGEVVPNLTLYDQHGDQVQLHQFYGRTVILEIGAEWCGPCHDVAPYVEAFWREVSDDAVVLSVLMDDRDFEMGDEATVARWIERHGSTSAVVRLESEADREAIAAWANSLPTLAIIDPTLRLAKFNANSVERDPWFSQLFRRLALTIDGRIGDDEVCDDGIDNDLDLWADCSSDACVDAPACALESSSGTLGPCGPAWVEGSVVDVYTVTVPAGVAELEVDTVGADSVFEPIVWARRLDPLTDWNSLLLHEVGDDEFECSYPAADYSCARGFLSPGSYEVVIGAGSGGEELDGDCVNPESGSYELRLRGASAELTEDDVPLPFE